MTTFLDRIGETSRAEHAVLPHGSERPAVVEVADGCAAAQRLNTLVKKLYDDVVESAEPF